MNVWHLTLYSPEFWHTFIAQMPPLDEKAEERMLTSLAIRAGLPKERVRERMDAYLRGLGAELTATALEGNNTIN